MTTNSMLESKEIQGSGMVLLKPAEAAQYLKLSRVTLYRLVEKRTLPFYRVGGSLRLSRKDLDEYLSSHRIESIVK